jgi:hypothetical protein
LKKLFIALATIGVTLTGAALFVTKGSGPIHSTLRAADLPPLIPTRAFYADPRSASGYVASSEARYVSFEKASLTGRSIIVKDLSSNDEIAEFPVGLTHIRWHPTKPLLRFIFEGNDWEADPFSPERENWKRISPVQLSGGVVQEPNCHQ